MAPPQVRSGSVRRSGRLVPREARRLRGRSIALAPGRSIAWHSTNRREELLVVITGPITLEFRGRRGRSSMVTLATDQCAFVPSQTWHCVRNRSSRPVRYLYLTA